MVKFEKPMQITCDFQFAEMALIRLKAGTNEFMVHTAEPAALPNLTGELLWK
jgi:hypothetical protein